MDGFPDFDNDFPDFDAEEAKRKAEAAQRKAQRKREKNPEPGTLDPVALPDKPDPPVTENKPELGASNAEATDTTQDPSTTAQLEPSPNTPIQADKPPSPRSAQQNDSDAPEPRNSQDTLNTVSISTSNSFSSCPVPPSCSFASSVSSGPLSASGPFSGNSWEVRGSSASSSSDASCGSSSSLAADASASRGSVSDPRSSPSSPPAFAPALSASTTSFLLEKSPEVERQEEEIARLCRSLAELEGQRRVALQEAETQSTLVMQAKEQAKQAKDKADRDCAALRAELDTLRKQSVQPQANSGVSEMQSLKDDVGKLNGEVARQQVLLSQVVSIAMTSAENLEARIDSKVSPPCSGVSVHVSLTPALAEGSFTLSWSRSFGGSLFESIEGAHQLGYTPTADDVGAVLKAKVFVNDGPFVEAETGPVMVKKDICDKLVGFLKKGTFDLDLEPSGHALVVTKKNIKLKVGRKTEPVGDLGPDLRVVLDAYHPEKFSVKHPNWNAESAFTTPPNLRDLYVLALRLLNAHNADSELERECAVRWQILQLNTAKLRGSHQDSKTLRTPVYASESEKLLDKIRTVLKGEKKPPAFRPAPRVEHLETKEDKLRPSESSKDEHRKEEQHRKEEHRKEEHRKEEHLPKSKIDHEKDEKKKDKHEKKQKEKDEDELKEPAASRGPVQYDEEGFIIVKAEEHAFSKYETKHDSDSEGEEERKAAFKVNIRQQSMPLPSSYKNFAFTPASPKGKPGTLKPIKDKKKKKDERSATLKPTARPVEFTVPDAGAEGDPFGEFATLEVSKPEKEPDKPAAASAVTVHQVRATIGETVNVKIREEAIDVEIRGEVNLARVGTELAVIPFNFKVPGLKRLLANDTCVIHELDNFRATFQENQDSVCAVKYIVEADPAHVRETIPVFARVVWDCQPFATIVEINYDINPKFKAHLADLKFLISVDPPGSVSKCTLSRGPSKAKGLWNGKTQQLMWKLPPIADSDKGRLLFKLVTTTKSVPSPMDVFFTAELDETFSGAVIEQQPATQLEQTRISLKTGLYSVMPSAP